MRRPKPGQPAEMRPTLAFVGHSNSITSLAFSSDGNTLLSGSYDQTVIAWNVQSEQMQRLFHTGAPVHGVVFSNDRFAIDSGGHVWDVVTGDLRHSYHRTNAPLALSPDGATLAFVASNPRSEGWIVRLTHVRTGRTRGTFACGDIYPETLAFSGDGQLVAVAGPSNQYNWIWVVTLWDWRNQRMYTSEFKDLIQLFGATLPGWTRLVAVSSRSASICDAETGELVQIWQDQFWNSERSDLYERGMTLSGDGRLLAVGYCDGMVTIRDVTTREIIWKLKAHEGWVRALAFTRDNRTLATAGDDKVIHLWDVTGRMHKSALPGRKGGVARISFDGREPLLMAAGQDGLLRYWNLHSGVLQQTARERIDNAGDAGALKPENVRRTEHKEWRGQYRRTVGEGENRTTASVASGEIVVEREGWSRAISIGKGEQDENIEFALTPDGKTLLTAYIYGAGGVHLWDVESGRHVRTIRTMDDPLALAFSQDGATLAIGTAYDEHIVLVPVVSRLRGRRLTGDTNLRRCPPASLRRAGGIYWLKGHTNSLRCLAYSPDGRWLASGAADNTVRLWSAVSNRLCVTLCALPDNEWIAYTPENDYTASPNAGRFLRWQLGNELLPLEAYATRFRQPERIQAVLKS